MLRKLIRKLVYREKATSEAFVEYLRKNGVQVGKHVKFYSPPHTLIDMSFPWLITIGDHVKITHGVIILTHDYSWAVLKRLPKNNGRILGAQSPVEIGNNVFIGMNAIITKGTTIGDNVIIGAGSVVTGVCESNSVYAGVPARKIMTIEEFYRKREEKQFEEAKQIAQLYYKRFDKYPPREIFVEHFPLFCDADEAMQVPAFKSQMATGECFDECYAYMKENAPMFATYDDFLGACFCGEE